MLHTFVGADREAVREIAREPMKDYLRSAAALIKQYAWAFPAFKKPAGVSNPMQLDLSTLSEEEMDGVLEFAFRRYFEDSRPVRHRRGLRRARRAAEAHRRRRDRLPDRLRRPDRPGARGACARSPRCCARANAPTTVADDDFSIAAQIVRHGVTHLQCTPTMARMLLHERRGARGARPRPRS